MAKRAGIIRSPIASTSRSIWRCSRAWPCSRSARRAPGASPVWSLRLSDGRWLVARAPWQPHGGPGIVLAALALILLAVAVAAFPVVRRLTRRLERLQSGVESLGAGDLAARVEIRGH